MKKLPITKGRERYMLTHALVDDDVFEWAQHFNWYLQNGRYPAMCFCGEHFLLHRLVIICGDGFEIDHKDRNTLNCQRANLREVTDAQQQQNRTNTANSSSRFRGVCWNSEKSKWKARVKIYRTEHHLGYFTDEDEAGRACSEFRKAHMPYAVEA